MERYKIKARKLGKLVAHAVILFIVNILLLMILRPVMETMPVEERLGQETISAILLFVVLPLNTIFEDVVFKKIPDWVLRKTIFSYVEVNEASIFYIMLSVFALIGVAAHIDIVQKADTLNTAKFFLIQAINGGWIGYIFLRNGLLGSIVVHYLYDLILVGVILLIGA